MDAKPGTWVWLKIPADPKKKTKEYVEACLVKANDGSTLVFETADQQELYREAGQIREGECWAMSESSQRGVEDMANMTELHLEAMVHNCRLRLANGLIYTFIGTCLVALNPYGAIDGLYGSTPMDTYARARVGALPPHIYALSREAHACLLEAGQNQCLLISGESGAGKTESSKLLISHLAAMSGGHTLIEQQIQDAHPILEALGNAKTVYNNNSSRFGKYIEIQYCRQGTIRGAKITDFLLEKSRVAKQSKGERNYHIFYSMIAGGPDTLKELLHLGPISSFHYLSQSGTTTADGIDDAQSWSTIEKALELMGVSKDTQLCLWKVLAGILHLGNIAYTNRAGAKIPEKEALQAASTLLGLESKALERGLTMKTMKLRGEMVNSALTVEQAEDSRDSLAMTLYAAVFQWVLCQINRMTESTETKHIGVLDIFGFENFESNSFEQFCINYANEKLTQHFNDHIFALEQKEYQKDKISWSSISFLDNQECLDLIEKKLGMLSLLDEESMFPKGTDESLLDKYHAKFEAHPHYIKPRLTKGKFGIKHYAGEVTYDPKGWLIKNRDVLREDLLETLQESTHSLVLGFFGDCGEKIVAKAAKGSTRRQTIGQQFKNSLLALMATVTASRPHYIRCIKPNMEKSPTAFSRELVANQLLYSGVIETVRIRRLGYPLRYPFGDFYDRFRILQPNVRSQSHEVMCRKILESFRSEEGTQWQLGLTKVFMKEDFEQKLERLRQQETLRYSKIVAMMQLGGYARLQFKAMQSSSVVIQTSARGYLARRELHRRQEHKRLTIRAATIIQTRFRVYVARKEYLRLMEEKRRLEEERLRREEEERLRRIEEERRRKEEEEKRRKEEEERRIQEEIRRKEEEERRKREEEEMRLEMERAEKVEKERLERLRIQQEEEERQRLILWQAEMERIQREEEERTRREEEERRRREEEEASRRAEEDKAVDEERLQLEQLVLVIKQAKLRAQQAQEAARRRRAEEEADMQQTMEREQERAIEEERKRLEREREEEERRREMAEIAQRLELEERERQAREMQELENERLEAEAAQMEIERLRAQIATNAVAKEAMSQEYDLPEPQSPAPKDEPEVMAVHATDIYDLKEEGYLYVESGGKYQQKYFQLREGRLYYSCMQLGNAITSGWLSIKQKGAISTTWKKRWCVASGHHFFQFNYEDDAQPRAMLTVAEYTIEPFSDKKHIHCIRLVSEGTKIEMDCETKEAWGQWLKVLKTVKKAGGMGNRLVDVCSQPCTGTENVIDLQDIQTVGPTNEANRPPHSFAIITRTGVIYCAAKSEEDVQKWINVLRPRKERVAARSEGGLLLVSRRPFQGTEKATKASWCTLDQSRLLVYRSRDSAKVEGLVHFDRMTCIHWDPDGSNRKQIMLGTFRGLYFLMALTEADAERWFQSLQLVLDALPPMQSNTEMLLQNLTIDDRTSHASYEDMYRGFPILTHQSNPTLPLLSLPYYADDRSSLHELACTAFRLINDVESDRAIDNIQAICELCLHYPELRSEVYCQMIKQLIHHPHEGKIHHQRLWKNMVVICSTFLPSRPVLKYVTIVLTNTKDDPKALAGVRTYAQASLEALPRTRHLISPYPPSHLEIVCLQNLKPIVFNMLTLDGKAHQVTFSATATASDVLAILLKRLGLNADDLVHRYALYEDCREYGLRMIEPRSVVTAILGKWEALRLRGLDISTWTIGLRIVCYGPRPPVNEKETLLEFYQAHDAIVRGWIPTRDQALFKFAAYRLQYQLGDKSPTMNYEGLGALLPSLFPPDFVEFLAQQENIALNDTQTPTRRWSCHLEAPVSPHSTNSHSYTDINSAAQLTQKNSQASRKSSIVGGFTLKSKKCHAATNGTDDDKYMKVDQALPPSNSTESLMDTLKSTMKRLKPSPSQATSTMRPASHINKVLGTGIEDYWVALQGTSREEVVDEYLAMVRRQPTYGAQLFVVEEFEGAGLQELWLSVTQQGLVLRRKGETTVMRVYPFEGIYGTELPARNVFGVRVDGHSIKFRTKSDEHSEISKLMTLWMET